MFAVRAVAWVTWVSAWSAFGFFVLPRWIDRCRVHSLRRARGWPFGRDE